MTKGRVAFCTPTVSRPYPQFLEACEPAFRVVEDAGWKADAVYEVGNAYISGARATMLRKAINAMADVIVFLDHDVSFEPGALLALIETDGDVVSGTYRFKEDEEKYMGWMQIVDHALQQRDDGCIRATHVPAGFLKITRAAVNRFMEAYPELVYGERCLPHIDLFNHGTIEGVWFGEDYAFSRRWTEAGGDIWLRPDLSIDHHSPDKAYPGNFAAFIKRKSFKVHSTQG